MIVLENKFQKHEIKLGNVVQQISKRKIRIFQCTHKSVSFYIRCLIYAFNNVCIFHLLETYFFLITSCDCENDYFGRLTLTPLFLAIKLQRCSCQLTQTKFSTVLRPSRIILGPNFGRFLVTNIVDICSTNKSKLSSF